MRSAIALFALRIARNVGAGTRLALFLKVSPLEFRVSATSYAALVFVSFGFWLGAGMFRVGFPGAIDASALILALAQVPFLLFICVLAAEVLRQPALALAFAVLLTASDPLFEVAGAGARAAFETEALADWAGVANWMFLAWAFAVIARVQRLLTGWRWGRSTAALMLFAAMLAVFGLVWPRSELWVAVPRSPGEDAGPSVAQEDLFHLQGGLLEYRLAELEPERPGVEDLYFIGVAPYDAQDTFVRELGVVKDLMDERFDTGGRSLALVNHPATLSELPIATATNLRAAIDRVAAGINVEEDVLFLFLTTHGSSASELAFELAPLKLHQMTPTALARMLNDSGIKWKAIVISACYSGGFVEPLKDDHTLIITAADASSQSFGCEYDSDFTWFSRAFFDRALRRTYSFTEAFEQAKAAIAAREKSQGLAPSNPQIFLGGAMQQKLESLSARLRALGARSLNVQASRGDPQAWQPALRFPPAPRSD